MQQWVLPPPDKIKTATRSKNKRRRKKKKGRVFSWRACAQLNTGVYLYLREREREREESSPSHLSTCFLLGARGLLHSRGRALGLQQDKIRRPSVCQQLFQAELSMLGDSHRLPSRNTLISCSEQSAWIIWYIILIPAAFAVNMNTCQRNQMSNNNDSQCLNLYKLSMEIWWNRPLMWIHT